MGTTHEAATAAAPATGASAGDQQDQPLPTEPGVGAAHRPGLAWWQAITGGAVVAAAVNLAIFLVGRAADASFTVMDGGELHDVAAADVVGASIVPFVAGTVLAAVLARFWSAAIRLAQVVGGTLALASAAGPLTGDTDGGTGLALAAMHVVVGVAVVASLEAARRRH